MLKTLCDEKEKHEHQMKPFVISDFNYMPRAQSGDVDGDEKEKDLCRFVVLLYCTMVMRHVRGMWWFVV